MYGKPESEAEFHQLGQVLSESFAFPAPDVPAWFASAGRENVRVLRRGAEVIGGLILVPMGQFWGGRSVKLGGFSGVAVAAHARGGSTATTMMTEGLRELRREGFAIAGLYPATQPLYRRVGFEQAGARFEMKGPLTALPKASRTLPIRPVRPTDLPAIQQLYVDHARRRPGY